MKPMDISFKLPFALALAMIFFLSCDTTYSQEKRPMVRLAKLVIHPAQLEQYKIFLKEEIEASMKLEPGVLTLYAVSEKENPTHFTILEIYTDSAAYRAHLQNGGMHLCQYISSVQTVL